MTTTATTITVDSLPIASTIDPVGDRILIYTLSATDIQGISRNTYLGLSSQPVGINDSQTLTTKTLDNSNIITVKAANFTIQDGSDTTKQAKFVASGITTGTTRSYTLPDVSDTLITLTATQTLTNKTFTSPVITGGSIDNTSITVDTLSGHTTSNSGTIYGIGVTVGVITTAGSVGSGANVTNGVQAAALATNAITLGYAQVTASSSTASATAVQITGLTSTVTIPAGGRRIKITAFCGSMYSTGSTGDMQLTIWDGTVGSGTQLQSANITAAALSNPETGIAIASVTPAAGSKTYNIGLQTSAGTANFVPTAAMPAFILVEAIQG